MQADVLLHPFFLNRGNGLIGLIGLIRGMNLIDLNSVLTEKRGRPSRNEDGSVPLW